MITRDENGMDYTVPVCDLKKRTVYSRAEKKGEDKKAMKAKTISKAIRSY